MISKLKFYFWFVVQIRAMLKQHIHQVCQTVFIEVKPTESGSLAGVQVPYCPITLWGKHTVFYQG